MSGLYTPNLSSTLALDLSLATTIEPYFQPIIEVASGLVTGYEALARYRDASGRVQSAGFFFTDASISTERKRKIDQIVRFKALSRLAEMPENTRLSINISPQWISLLSEHDAIPTIEMVRQLKIAPDRVVIELVELGGDLQRLLAVVKQYRQAGIRVAIDDFGAGFSQLDRVIALEPDIIKLDMQLFKQAAKGGIAETVVEALVELSIKNGTLIICEGVETEAELHFGLKCGARYMQGYLFSEAQIDFVETTRFQTHVAAMRQRFFVSMSAKSEQRKQHNFSLQCEVVALRDWLKTLVTAIPLEMINHIIHPQIGILRFFICDQDGQQITPNYFWHSQQQTWIVNRDKIGFNWAWRPYFYRLSQLESHDLDEIIASKTYLDLDTAMPCKTFATRLDLQRVLLVDVLSSKRRDPLNNSH